MRKWVVVHETDSTRGVSGVIENEDALGAACEYFNSSVYDLPEGRIVAHRLGDELEGAPEYEVVQVE